MTSHRYTMQPDFLEHAGRRLFHLLLRPVGEARGSVLFLHAFAEEMHMSRRNVAATARALATAGCNVMLLDLSGCGDGAGDFVDADWNTWREDARGALAALRALDAVPVALWGMRLGALLATDTAVNEADIARLLLWQPVLNGEQQIDQFLRLKSVAGAMGPGAGFDRKHLWGQLRDGHALEVAGYELSARMAQEIARVRLADLLPPCPVHWLEVSAGGELARPGGNVRGRWSEQGVRVSTGVVPGPAFWRNHDAPLNDALCAATLEALL
ncbi:MAG: hydrolase 2, exosortase A system-associated [Halioglobus sp.]|nr:hydrolase 2, exosortase A system-associated [Halioglobus sp.]|tara:strand:- start:3377 stop:4186 length:810 start_codon:yes stop_codon:yes gene_type:complete